MTTLTILVTYYTIEETDQTIYHSSFKEQCGISHWHSVATTHKEEVIRRAREVATENGYDIHAEIELVEAS